jgi:ribose/xylose/arabinose/galactoside ABC-type transport system permease subunit
MATTSSSPQPSATTQAAVEEQRTPISLGRESGSVLVLLIFVVVLILTTNDFLTVTNLDNLVRQVAVFAILSVGELFVILTGGIDLSVGSVLGLSGGVTALILTSGAPIPLAILVGLLVGLGVGLINGLLVSRLKLPPFIATLGMLGIARGVVLLLTGGQNHRAAPRCLQRHCQRVHSRPAESVLDFDHSHNHSGLCTGADDLWSLRLCRRF